MMPSQSHTDVEHLHNVAGACIQYVNNNTSLLTGFTLAPRFVFDRGNVGLGSYYVAVLKLINKVAAIVGPLTSSMSTGILPMATLSLTRVPLISYGAVDAGLSGQKYFFRGCPGMMEQLSMFVAMCKLVSLTHVGLLYASTWSENVPKWQEQLKSAQLREMAQGMAPAMAKRDSVQLLAKQVGKFRHFTARFIMVMSSEPMMTMMYSPAVCAQLSPGVGWWLTNHPEHANSQNCSMLVGWLHGTAHISKTPMYQHFDNAFTRLTGSSFETAMPTLRRGPETVSIWNSILVVVHAVRRLFGAGVFSNDLQYSNHVYNAMMGVSFTGVGSNITFDASRGLIGLFDVFSLNQDSDGIAMAGGRRKIGSWSQTRGLQTTQSIQWPGSVVPRDPEPIITIASLFPDAESDRVDRELCFKACRLAAQEINADPNLLPTLTLAVETQSFQDERDLLQKANALVHQTGRYYIAGFVVGYYAIWAKTLASTARAYSRPHIAPAASNSMLNDDLAQGWMMRNCFSQLVQAEGIAALLTVLGWNGIAILRQSWGTQFKDDLLKKKVYIFGEVLESGNRRTDRSAVKWTNKATSSALWLIWTSAWSQSVAMLKSVNLLGPGYTYIVYNAVSSTEPLVEGFLCVDMQASSSYEAWLHKHISNSSSSAYPGLYYEAVKLFGAALHVAVEFSKRGQMPLNGTRLRDALKSVNLAGVTSPTLSLTTAGERNALYVLLNHVNGTWDTVGEWNSDARTWNLYGPFAGCECSGWEPTFGKHRGQGGTCAEGGYFLDWCYVASTCTDKSIRESEVYPGKMWLPGCRNRILYSDSTHVQPPPTRKIDILVLLPFGGKWGGGARIAPAIDAAMAMVQRSETLLPDNFNVHYTMHDTVCDAGRALSYVAESKTPPNLIIGPGCSDVATNLNKMTAFVQIPSISPAAEADSLSSKEWFARLVLPRSQGVAAMLSFAKSLELSSFGALVATDFYDVAFTSAYNRLVSEMNATSPCGCVQVSPCVGSKDADSEWWRGLKTELRRMHTAPCRFMFVAILYEHELKPFLDHLPSSIAFSDGDVAWAISWELLAGLVHPTLNGWFELHMPIDKSSPGYIAMEAGYRERYQQRKFANMTAYEPPTYYSCIGWNTVVAVASVLTRMFRPSRDSHGGLPIYTSNRFFPEQFMKQIQIFNSTSLTAGMPIQIDNRTHDGILTLHVRNLAVERRSYSISYHTIGDWNPNRGYAAIANASGLVYRQEGRPKEALPIQCRPGQRNVNSYNCQTCRPGTFTDAHGLLQCVSCPLKYYASEAGASTCTRCALGRGGQDGQLTWAKEAQNASACRCQSGYYASNYYSAGRICICW